MQASKPRILVVDDIKDNRAILLRRLARSDFDVAEADGGRSALSLIGREHFDLVLLDIAMPDLDGIEVLKRVRQKHSPLNLPVIMVTAHGESSQTAAALRLGANDYVTKPVDFQVALARIESQLAHKQDQSRLEGELDMADQRLRSLVDQLPAGLALKNRNGEFLTVNTQYGAFLGFDSEDAVGRTQDFFQDAASAEVVRLDEAALAAEAPTHAQIMVGEGEDRRVFLATSFPIRGSGSSVGIGTSLFDVTERWRAERELVAARDAAEAGNRAKSEFLAAMSHELRTPLNAIIGFADIMAADTLGRDGYTNYKIYAKDIGDSGRHLLAVINDVLDLAKQDAGRLELIEDTIDIASMIEYCRQTVSRAAQDAGVQLSVAVDSAMPLVMGDQRRITQVLLNLLSNAIKFTNPGGQVDLTARNVDGCAVLEVRDTGIGMTNAEVSVALEPFRQIDSRLSRKYQGTGLGLPISKKLTELHGGRFAIESVPGGGTCITVTLPAERAIHADRSLVS
ncbi:response regulator [Rhodospirillaceae bacterium SYSU D60014]|uniref:response regulator n=1 Tax=Virgifigura deserti TaxID=2268457 RepID=UPI000E66CEAA